ncbi:MAG: sigma-54-dependent Fis family transcriptional regulator [Acidobacteria bacterium]|nr:MAG: sigma-54-dependent Fis family transcriptional regulator [Acidobacteriota bacterium]MCE7958710.1 sigma-54-dependent Fis family transcriptional regulator [Acidobacteria bacterium ACB2]
MKGAPATVLVVDDDSAVAASLSLLLRQSGYRPVAAAGPEEARARLAQGGVGLVLSDMNFTRGTTGEEGLALLASIRSLHPGLPVVLMTAWGSIELAVRGMRAGAADFVTKPWTPENLLATVATALALSEAVPVREADVPTREELDEAAPAFAPIAGRDPGLVRVLSLAARVAPTDASVLVTGESGTGKELLAEAIHRASPRGRGPFVKVNLGGIPTSLFESEMFGHVKGAFTDARQDRTGRFAAASGGSIFLDEVGEIEPAAQVKLLRVLQDRSFEVLGTSTTRTVDVRVVSATNRDLGEAVLRGAFREDLLYRLNLITLRLPALRERPSDVPLLAERFLAELSRRQGHALSLAADAVEWLSSQAWPGNVRQLKHLVERSVLLSGRERLGAADFAFVAGMDEGARRVDAPPADARTLEEIEREAISRCLARHAGNLSRAAEELGLSRAALYRRLEKYGISA